MKTAVAILVAVVLAGCVQHRCDNDFVTFLTHKECH